MKLFNRLIAIVLAILTVFALAACGSSPNNVGGVDNKNDKGGKDDKASTVEISDAIKAAMEKNKHLTQANFFFVEDGTILTLGGDSEKKYAGEYSKLTGVKQLIAGAGLSSFALTESGELYCRDAKIAENVSMMAYCTTNVNVEGFCVINNELRRVDSYQHLQDNALNYMFKNYPSEDKLTGDIAFIEVDKHDFIVLNTEGKFFAYWTSEEYSQLDYTSFEDLCIVDIAKKMKVMGGGVQSLTVAGVKGDGTPVATGTYANDILSWGKLADLAMSDGIIVGLTEDGKVKMTGDYAEKMKSIVEGWTNIVAIEVGHATGGNIDDIVTAIDSDGTFHFACIMNEYNEPETGTISVDGVTGGRSCHKYVNGTEFYTTYEGKWEENTDE